MVILCRTIAAIRDPIYLQTTTHTKHPKVLFCLLTNFSTV